MTDPRHLRHPAALALAAIAVTVAAAACSSAIWLPSVANAFSIFLLKRFFDSIPDELLAASAVAAVPTVIFFLIFQRNIMSGLTAGSLKG